MRKRISKLFLTFIVLGLVVLCFLADTSSSQAKNKKTLKLNHKSINYQIYFNEYKSVSVKGVPWYKDVTWEIADGSIASIVTGTVSGQNFYWNSRTINSRQGCYIHPKKPGTTKVIARVKGYKSAECTIRIVEHGDAIGYYAKTGKDRYNITAKEKKAAQYLKESINNIISPEMTSVEKIKAVNDYLSKVTQYDYENYNSHKHVPYDSTITGPLIYHKAVCQGYAVSFDAYMYYLGIPSKLISGTANYDGGGHAWNLVKLDDGCWYQIDVTWNDDDKNNAVTYEYFLKNDDFMLESHSWDRSQYPVCNGEKYKDYTHEIHKKIIMDNYPVYTFLESKSDAINYLTEVCRNRQEYAAIIYRGDEWMKKEEYQQIRDSIGFGVNFWWDDEGSETILGEYKRYYFKLGYY